MKSSLPTSRSSLEWRPLSHNSAQPDVVAEPVPPPTAQPRQASATNAATASSTASAALEERHDLPEARPSPITPHETFDSDGRFPAAVAGIGITRAAGSLPL